MEKELVLDGIKTASGSQQRKFRQSYELIMNLKDIDLKKPEHQVNLFVPAPHQKGRKIKVCIFCGPEMAEQAKAVCDKVILLEEFGRYDKKQAKKLAEEFDYFIAQANVMTKVASAFGRALGPRGKMPNPKAGCVVPPNSNLKAIYEKLQNTINVKVRGGAIIQCAVGNSEMDADKIAENIMTIYDAAIHNLPSDKNNIKNMYVKLTMGKSVEIKETEQARQQRKKR